MIRENESTESMIFDESSENLPAIRERAESSVKVINDNVVLHDGDSPVVRVKLAQSSSAEGTAGKFYSADTLEEFDELMVVPIRVQAIRTLWPESGFSRDRQPECASLDGVKAVESFSDGSRPLFPGQTVCSANSTLKSLG
jgi:hypothetical protein